MMNGGQKGQIKIVLLIIVVALAAALVYVVGIRKEPNGIIPQASTSEAQILSNLDNSWDQVQSQIPLRPGYHNQELNEKDMWTTPWTVQFLAENIVLVYIEDDNNPQLLILKYENNNFVLIELFRNRGSFTLAEWETVRSKYGNLNYPVSTYAVSLIRNGEVVNYPKLTKIPENWFVKDETAGWKTYKNEEYNFEFQYPENFYISFDESLDSNSQSYTVALASTDNLVNWEVRVFMPQTNYYAPDLIEKERTIEVDGVSCKHIFTKVLTRSKTQAVICRMGGYDYVIDYDDNNPDADNPEQLGVIYSQILSTFRFTK